MSGSPLVLPEGGLFLSSLMAIQLPPLPSLHFSVVLAAFSPDHILFPQTLGSLGFQAHSHPMSRAGCLVPARVKVLGEAKSLTVSPGTRTEPGTQ